MCILVVDDEPSILLFVADCLEDAGHEALTADGPVTALRWLHALPGYFTGLITDLNMAHELTGGDLIETMRRTYPSIPMLLTTGSGLTISETWRAKHGVEMLPKPYTGHSLMSTLDRLRVAKSGGERR